MPISQSDPRVGVLGGGQLAQMLCEAAHELGVDLTPLVQKSDEPAFQVTKSAVVAPLLDEVSYRNFFKMVDAVIFENEFVDVELLAHAAQNCKLSFFPKLETLGLLRNKLSQKKLLTRLQIPTAPYLEGPPVFASEDEITIWLDRVVDQLGAEPILKWALYGYDGKGTFFYAPEAHKEALFFIKSSHARGAQVYAESRIPFDQELALLSAARGPESFYPASKTECVHYPLVRSEQKNGICHRVSGPASNFGLAADLQQKAELIARNIACDLSLVGVFALEFFHTSDGQLLVNEIAPRVHNSGHFSQDGLETLQSSQFHLHLKGILGMPLAQPVCRPYFAMLNILGPEPTFISRAPLEITPTAFLSPQDLLDAPPIYLHWYRKKEIKTGRKLGHFNTWAQNPVDFKAALQKLDRCHAQLMQYLRNEDLHHGH